MITEAVRTRAELRVCPLTLRLLLSCLLMGPHPPAPTLSVGLGTEQALSKYLWN